MTAGKFFTRPGIENLCNPAADRQASQQ